MNMNLEQALRTAIEYEIRVRDLYREAAGKVADENGRKVAGQMAVEEQEHVDYLVKMLNEWKETGLLPDRKIPRTVPDPGQLAEHIRSLKDRMDGKTLSVAERDSDISVLNRAVEVERETSGFYQKMVDEMPAGSRDLFRHFLDIEKGHLAIVESEIDFLYGAGYWFDFPEFSLETE
jgi:rubrerythrin